MLQYTPWQRQNQLEQKFRDAALDSLGRPGRVYTFHSARDPSHYIVPEGCAQPGQAGGEANAENPECPAAQAVPLPALQGFPILAADMREIRWADGETSIGQNIQLSPTIAEGLFKLLLSNGSRGIFRFKTGNQRVIVSLERISLGNHSLAHSFIPDVGIYDMNTVNIENERERKGHHDRPIP